MSSLPKADTNTNAITPTVNTIGSR
jgi:hypothetical protein